MIDKSFLNKKILIKEKVEAPIIIVEKNDANNLLFYKKHNRKITFLDKVLTKIYDEPISYLIDNKNNIRKNKIYKFHYIYDVKPVSIEYNCDEKFILSEVLNKASNSLFNDEYFFKQNVILEKTIDNKLLKLMKDINHYGFSTFIENINSDYKSNLGNNFANRIEVLIQDSNLILKKYNYNFNKNVTKRYTNDKNILIIKEIIDFVSSLNLNKIYFKKTDYYYKNYIELVFQLYLLFEHKYNITVETPEFMSNDVFSLNKRYLNSPDSVKNEPLFKLFLNIFRKEKKFNNLMINDKDFKKYKSVIYKINNKLTSKQKRDFITFNDFIKKK